ncbi:ABC transporter ATP-binding protein [Roseospira goensis]|uniref:Quaternary amine transport ATP-binding protein n=1 Tax=Roseospira goensis TaxID=391922 RepID=A0A7W6RXA9_9PROT|nr:ABC transporter ATP-binding protein [Roseospira goensis]MBB4284786.1 osmoprotectant transport system ATP-binding protein [Roseospira goensis]
MITLENVTKIFESPSGAITAVDHVSFEVPEGEICILLGPSGCGKTTTMKMVNRLIEKTGGKIFVDGKDIDDYDPVTLRRTMGYVIQQIGLFPNMTVEENIMVVPRLVGTPDAKARKRAAELLGMVALDPGIFLKRFPRELSGGQQQRVGVARALAADPPVLIMDEPFGAIDPINRETIQDEFLKMQANLKKTIMFVSHDIDEAVKMGDRIAIFREGRLEQYDRPDTVLAHPTNSFVREFVGGDRTLKRLRLVRVGDAMHPGAPYVFPEDRIGDAVARMHEYGHRSIVVLNREDMTPTGLIRLAEVEEARGSCGEHAMRLPGRVHVDADLRRAVSEMFTQDTTWLACVDSDGRFKGHITQRAITHLLGETYRHPNEGVVPDTRRQRGEAVLEPETGPIPGAPA